MLLLLTKLPVGSGREFYNLEVVEKVTAKNRANAKKDSRNRAGTGLST